MFCDDILHDFNSIADLLQCFCEVDDVKSVALFKNEAFHFWIPTAVFGAQNGHQLLINP